MKKQCILLTCLLVLSTISGRRAVVRAAQPQALSSGRTLRSPRAGHHDNAGEFLPAEVAGLSCERRSHKL